MLPRITLANTFTQLFAPLGLSPRAVSTSFGCRQNIALCLQVGLRSKEISSQLIVVNYPSDRA